MSRRLFVSNARAIMFAMMLVGLGIAPAQANATWTTLLSVTFPILAMVPGSPVTCTGWFAAPRHHPSAMRVSVYVTAGHCPAPHLIRTATGFEQMAILARITRPGVDATVGLRLDPRPARTFPTLATEAPREGDRALVAGYSAGHLTEAILTAMADCPAEFLCFHSDQALRGGMSGAPIVSLRTGDILGVLVATAWQAKSGQAQHIVMATPVGAVRTFMDIAAPDVPSGDSFEHVPDASAILRLTP